jgi:DNA (cytosine-5)-methyltransferase 1
VLKEASFGRVTGSFYGSSDSVFGAESVKCGDLFAGAGGFSLAAMNLGADVRFSVEFDKHACATYKRNFVRNGWPRVYERDIVGLSPEELETACFSESEACDLILGGPPCQGFSVHRIKDSGKDDPRNHLIHRYFRFVHYLQPLAFIMENVPGMLWPRHKSYVDDFYEEADSAGYDVREPVALEAADFGVPQKRKRVFVLGVRRGIDLDLSWPPSGRFCQGLTTEDEMTHWRTARDAFSLPMSNEDPNKIHMNHGSELIEAFKATPKNGGSRRDSGRLLPCHEKHDGHKDVYGRIDPNKPGPTMTTACINPSKGRFVHPTAHHGITARQAARFQTFPDDFVFAGGLIASGSQIGNAVPVLLGEAVLRPIISALVKYKG